MIGGGGERPAEDWDRELRRQQREESRDRALQEEDRRRRDRSRQLVSRRDEQRHQNLLVLPHLEKLSAEVHLGVQASVNTRQTTEMDMTTTATYAGPRFTKLQAAQAHLSSVMRLCRGKPFSDASGNIVEEWQKNFLLQTLSDLVADDMEHAGAMDVRATSVAGPAAAADMVTIENMTFAQLGTAFVRRYQVDNVDAAAHVKLKDIKHAIWAEKSIAIVELNTQAGPPPKGIPFLKQIQC